MEPKDSPVAPADSKVEPVVPAVKEDTLESIMSNPEPKQADVVPLAKYMEEKNEKRQLEREIAELKAKGIPPATDYTKLATDYGANPELVKKIFEEIDKARSTTVIETQKMDPETAQKLKELDDFKNEQNFNTKFDELYGKALDIVPDYKGIVNKDAIKSLVRLPENRNLTMSQIIEKTYNNAVKGMKTLESATPAAGKKGEVEPDMITMDDTSWNAIKNDPTALAKYNDHILANALSVL